MPRIYVRWASYDGKQSAMDGVNDHRLHYKQVCKLRSNIVAGT